MVNLICIKNKIKKQLRLIRSLTPNYPYHGNASLNKNKKGKSNDKQLCHVLTFSLISWCRWNNCAKLRRWFIWWRPWSWCTEVRCVLRRCVRCHRRCPCRGTRWQERWTTPPGTGTGRSPSAHLPSNSHKLYNITGTNMALKGRFGIFRNLS